MKRSGSGVHSLELAFEHTEDIVNTDFSSVCTDVHFDIHASVRLPIVDTFVLGNFTKPAITIAKC